MQNKNRNTKVPNQDFTQLLSSELRWSKPSNNQKKFIYTTGFPFSNLILVNKSAQKQLYSSCCLFWAIILKRSQASQTVLKVMDFKGSTCSCRKKQKLVPEHGKLGVRVKRYIQNQLVTVLFLLPAILTDRMWHKKKKQKGKKRTNSRKWSGGC